MHKYVVIIVLLSALWGCANEINYRGVPAPAWNKLTMEQRQLIVDQSYEEDINQSH